MNFFHKLIIPLLDKGLTYDDISKDSGFVGMATMDKNRPYLDSHIFLIYHMDMTNKAIQTRKKLATLGIYNKIDCRILGEPYRIFCFPIIGKTIINLMSNSTTLTANETLQIYKFWQFNDDDINHRMVDSTYIPELFKPATVPEFDYSPKDFIKYNEKGQIVL